MKIHQLIAARAARYPIKTAVVFDGQSISYQELMSRAASLAASLPRGELIGLCLPPSIDFVIAMLGVLSAGAAFVPVDTSAPQPRIDALFQSARVSRVLDSANISPSYQRELVPRNTSSLTEPGWIPVFTGMTKKAAGMAEENSGMTEEDAGMTEEMSSLAYVIFTSGSTGAPKGAMIEHSGLVDLIEAERFAFDFQPEDRVLQFASLGFDVSVFEILTTLAAGATLYIPNTEERRVGPSLLQFLRDQEISIATLLPTVLATIRNRDLPKLRVIVTGGEPCPQHIVDDWARGRMLFNAYGPTEATIGATCSRCVPGREVTIGAPFPHVKLYLLNDEMQEVAPGEKGEIFLGGSCVGRGYLYDEARTKEKFIPNPFGPGRLYRTGDFALYRPDGELDFLGRRDAQIKHRGVRIELGEIEHTLSQIEGVAGAAVFVEGDELVAFYLGERTPDELRDRLSQRLPASMLPGRLVRLAEPPLTHNTKWDKSKLREMLASGAFARHTDGGRYPESERLEDRRTKVESAHWTPFFNGMTETSTGWIPASAGMTEEDAGMTEEVASARLEKITQIFSRVLGREVRPDAHFFWSGGDSLSAAQVLFALHEEISPEAVRAFYHEPTPAAIERWLSGASFSAESGLDEPPALLEGAPRGHVLLTGATGYLGIFLLRALQAREDEIFCLVRAGSEDEAWRRLRENASHYSVELQPKKIRVVPFDLSAPRLPSELHRPSAVYHCAARVDLLRPYSMLRVENALGVASLLGFCGAETRFHFVSSYSAHLRDSGYGESKYAAEQLIKRAGLPWSISRPTFILGGASSIHQRDLFFALLTESLRQKRFPRLEGWLDLVSLDEVVADLLSGSLGERDVISGQSVSSEELVSALVAFGYEVSLCSFDAWRQDAGPAILPHLGYLSVLARGAARPMSKGMRAPSLEIFRHYLEGLRALLG